MTTAKNSKSTKKPAPRKKPAVNAAPRTKPVVKPAAKTPTKTPARRRPTIKSSATSKPAQQTAQGFVPGADPLAVAPLAIATLPGQIAGFEPERVDYEPAIADKLLN